MRVLNQHIVYCRTSSELCALLNYCAEQWRYVESSSKDLALTKLKYVQVSALSRRSKTVKDFNEHVRTAPQPRA